MPWQRSNWFIRWRDHVTKPHDGSSHPQSHSVVSLLKWLGPWIRGSYCELFFGFNFDSFRDRLATNPISTFVLFSPSPRNNAHDPSKTCITYDAINAAYLDARKRIRKYQSAHLQFNSTEIMQRIHSTDVSQPKGEWLTEDIATVGELLLDISIQLART